MLDRPGQQKTLNDIMNECGKKKTCSNTCITFNIDHIYLNLYIVLFYIFYHISD